MPVKRTEFFVSDKTLPLLAHLAGPKAWPVSPWAQYASLQEIRSEQWQLLVESGLSEDGRKLKEGVYETITVLKDATRFVRIKLISGAMVRENLVYYCGFDPHPVSISTTERGLLVEDPAPLQSLLLALIEFWGDSRLMNSSLKLSLGREEALVFAALTDLQRREILKARADLREFQIGEYSPDTITKALRETSENSQWLVSAFSNYGEWDIVLSADDLAAALEKLLKEAVIDKGAEGYSLAGEALKFANRFLLISQVLRFDTGSGAAAGQVERNGMLCLQAGMHDNLCLEFSKGILSIEAVSSHYITQMVDTFLVANFNLPGDVQQAAAKTAPPPGEAAAPEAAPRWYLHAEDKQYGPYTWEQLQKFAADGLLVGDSLVWQDGASEWVKAAGIEGLFS